MKVDPTDETSYTIVIAPPGIDRMFLHCPGCNDTFGPEDVDGAVVESARLFHFGYPPVMKRMYASGGAELAALMRGASDKGAITSLDLALPDPETPAGRADWRVILSATLPHTDIFLPSLEEILFMLRRERFEELTSTAASIADGVTADDLRSLAADCIELGAGMVVVKCGHAGAYLKVGRAPQSVPNWSGVELFEPTCRVDHIVSTTGSGDSSVAGFLAGFLRGLPPERCMALLTVVGAQNLSALDALSGVRPWQETMARLEAGPEKNPVPPRLAGL